jgi:hypothetical protein
MTRSLLEIQEATKEQLIFQVEMLLEKFPFIEAGKELSKSAIKRLSKARIADYISCCEGCIEQEKLEAQQETPQPETQEEVIQEAPQTETQEKQFFLSLKIESLLSPREFKTFVNNNCSTILEIHQAANQIKTLLREKYPSIGSYQVKLTTYSKEFKGVKHPIESLNEKHGEYEQCRIYKLLSLSDEEKIEYQEYRGKSTLKTTGFTSEGDIKRVVLKPINHKETISKLCQLLHSPRIEDVCIGLLGLTGLRPNELSLLSEDGYQRDLLPVDEFMIAFKGLSKQGKNEINVTSYWTRPTLAPSKIIFDAWNKIQSTPDLVQIRGLKFDSTGLRKAIERAFQRQFETTFNTIAAFDDDGELEKNDSCVYKLRAFYACTIREMVSLETHSEQQSKMFVQQSLSHKEPSVTDKYLQRFSSIVFENVEYIEVPTNIKSYGRQNNDEVLEMSKQFLSQFVNKPETIDPDEIIDILPDDLMITIGKKISNGLSRKKAVIELIEDLISKSKSVNVKVTVSGNIESIYDAIMKYNEAQNDVTAILYPSSTIINTIAKNITGKEIFHGTISKFLEQKQPLEIMTKLIGEDEIEKAKTYMKNANTTEEVVMKWNSTYHRKDSGDIVELIINTYMKE